MMTKDYFAISQKYIEDVLSGKVLAGEYVHMACKRQKDDLKRFRNGKEYVFNERAGNRICHFIENLTHVKGELAGRKIKLESWQVFILHTAFGWQTPEGNRRFRRVYIEVPRGNGKSCLSSGVALFCLCADHEAGAEVYSFATTRDQAKIVFGDAKAMAQANAALRQAFKLQVLANALAIPETNSTFQAKSAEGSTLDGLNTHLAVIDELHAHKTRAVYDVVETSLGKRRNSLMWVITTAGFNKAGICYEVRSMVTKVLSKAVTDETQFGVIYGLDKDDDWQTDQALIKANPNWGVSVRPEIIRSLQAKAMTLTSAANNFMTKHLNLWVNADVAWMDMRAWENCRSEASVAEFKGEPCFIGLDLATKIDIAAKVKIFTRKEEDGQIHFYLFPDFWLPSQAVETGKNSQYSGWARSGFLHVTDGAMTDFGAIRSSILEDASEYEIEEIAYDPWQATQLANELAEENLPALEFRQTVQNMSDPMKSFQALVLEGRLHHDGNPVMTWMVSNVVCHTDAKDNIFPRKEFPENKIDGVVAAIMGLARAETMQAEGTDLDLFMSL